MNEVKFINENIDDLKKIVKELEGASKMHKDQSVRIQKYIDDMKESVNEGKLDRIGSQLIKDLDKKYKNQKGTISTFNKIKKDLRKKMPRVSDRVAGSIANQYNDFLLDKDIKPKEKLRLMVLTLKGLGMNESVNEGKKRYYQQDRVGSAKYTISYHDGKKKHKDGSDFFDIKTFRNKKDLAKFVNTLSKSGYVYGFNESVNEAVEPAGNIKKVLDVAKNQQSKKIGGTLVDLTTANLMTQVWNKVNDKSKEKMNKMNAKQLINLILKLWDRVGTPRV